MLRPLPVVSFLLCAALLPAQNERPPEAFQIGVGLQQRGLHEEAARALAEFAGQAKGALAAEAWYRLGISQAELGKPDAAVQSFGRALQDRELRFVPECRYRLANLHKEAGRLAEAAQLFAQLCRDVAADHYLVAAARYGEGECRRDLGADAEALAAFQRALAAAKGEQQAYRFPALYQAGFALLRLGRPQEAQQAFAAAEQCAGDEAARAECRYLCGDAALRAKDLDTAEAMFAASLELGGEFADDATFGQAWAAVERQQPDAALAAFQRLLQRFPQSPLAPRSRLEVGRLLYRGKQYEAARKELQALLGKSDLDAALRQQGQELDGLCALELGKATDALPQLRAALAAAGPADKPRLSFALGEALAAQQQWQEALGCYQQVPVAAGAALYGDALYGACFCLHQLQRHADSAKVAAQLRRELPQHRLVVQATFALGEDLFAQQQYEAADQEYAAVPAQHALAGKARFKRAWCAYLRGQHAAAAAQFAAIAAVDGADGREEALAMSALAWLEAGQTDKALAAADTYRARHPKGSWLPRTERVAAAVLRQRKDLAGAAARLLAAQQASGDSPAAAQDRLERGELAYQQGDYAAARQLYEPLAQSKEAIGARALEGLAWCAFELGDDDGCAALLQRGLQHPAVGELRANLLELRSALHHRQQQWDAAAADAAEFLRDFQGHAKAPAMRYAEGLALSRAGKPKQARAVLAALAQAGGHERMDRVWYELGWACRKDGDEQAALAAFAAVAKQSQDDELRGEALLHLGQARLDAGDGDGARKLLQQVTGSCRGRALYRLGFLDLDAGSAEPQRLQAARQSFQAIVELGPQEPLHAEALFLVGECERRAGRPEPAAAAFRAMLAAAPQHERAASARLLLGECAVELNRPDEAVQQLEQLLQQPPADRGEQARAQLALGRARQLRGEHQRAEACFEKVTELSEGPAAAEAQFRIGESRTARSDLQGAADAFVKLPILYAHAPWVQRGLLQAGVTYEALRQPQKARRFYEELIRRFPEAAESRQASERLRGV